jgi:excisionase family DNA binding protein
MDLREAAGTLGVHYQTAYAWVRQGVLPARKVGRGYEISEADARELAARRRMGTQPPRPIQVRDWAAQSRRLYQVLAEGDETLAGKRVARLAGGVPLIDLCAHVIGPALRRIGDDWRAGRVSIAQEHRASAICERLIAGHASQPGGRPRGVAVATTPPGERHGLPALMAAACLREDHWLVHHLAADLPVAEVTRLAGDVGAGLVVLSSATTSASRRARGAAGEITAALPGVTVLTGRPGDSLYDLRAMAAGLPPRAGDQDR